MGDKGKKNSSGADNERSALFCDIKGSGGCPRDAKSAAYSDLSYL